MRSARHHVFWIRAAAKLVFGSFLFLFLASFLALPCMHADGGLFVSVVNGSEAAMIGAAAPVSRMSFRSSPQNPLSTAAAGASLLATSIPGAVPAASRQFASSWRDSIATQASVQAAVAKPFFHPARPAVSCVEQKIFKPRTNILKAFDIPLGDRSLRFLAVLVVLIGFGIVAASPLRPPVRARPGWRRLRSLPFASSDAPLLPYFAAQRDA